MDPTGQQLLRSTRGPMARVAISSVVRGRALGRTARKQTKSQPAAEPATAVQRRGGGDNENSHVNGKYENYVADGVISKEEAAMYTPDQLEFLVRKRSPSPTPRQAQLPKRPPAAANRAGAAESIDPIAQYVADGTITSQEAAMYTPDQLDFLIRKRKSEGTGPVSSQTRPLAAPRAASPVRRAASPAPRAASPAPRAVSPAPRAASSAPSRPPASRRTESVRSSDTSLSSRAAANNQAAAATPSRSSAPTTVAEYLAAGIITQEEADMYTPDQLEFLIRIRRRSASPAPLKSPAGAAARAKSDAQQGSRTAPSLKAQQSTTPAAPKDSGLGASAPAAHSSDGLNAEPAGSAVLVGATLATVVGIGVGLYFAPDDLSQLGKMFPSMLQQAEQVAPKPAVDGQNKLSEASAVKQAPAPAPSKEEAKPAAALQSPPPPPKVEPKKQTVPSTPATMAAEAKVKDVQEQQEKLREQQDQMKALLADLQDQEKNEKVKAQQAKLRAQQDQMKVMLGKLEVQEEKLEAKEEKLMEDLKAAESDAMKKAEVSAAKKAPEAKAPPPAATVVPEPKAAPKVELSKEEPKPAPTPKAEEAPKASAVKVPEPKSEVKAPAPAAVAALKAPEAKPEAKAPEAKPEAKAPEAKPEAKAPASQGDVKADAGGAKSAGGDAAKTKEGDGKPKGAEPKKEETAEEKSDNKLIFVGAGIAALGLGGLLFSPIGTFRRQDAEPEPVPEPVNKNLPIWARPQAQTVKRQVGSVAPPASEPVNLLVPVLAATVVGLTAGVAGGVLAALYLLPK